MGWRASETWARFWWGIWLPGALVLFSLLAFLAPRRAVGTARGAELLRAPDRAAAIARPPAPPDPRQLATQRQERLLQSGQNLGALLVAAGLKAPAAHEAALAAAAHVDVRQLRPGARLTVHLAASGEPLAADLRLPERGVLRLDRGAGRWQGRFEPFARRTEVLTVLGELSGSFEESVERAGAPADLAYAIGEVLQWDLDFNRDLRRGDRFAAVYEQSYLENQRDLVGAVLAVRYENRGRVLEAYRFGGEGYFDAQGRPLQKMFLRSPIPYSRVTSRFSSRRFHPVLKEFRPHYGVDYGAPVGTPARATAGGVVTFAGWDGGGGKTVKLRHANGYLTAYLHLSRYAEGLRVGDRVAQGEVIGYVGATGLATGPHLDYRVQKSGRWVDPLSLASVPAEAVATARLAEFEALRDELGRSLTSGAAYRTPVLTEPPAQLASTGVPAGAAPAAGSR